MEKSCEQLNQTISKLDQLMKVADYAAKVPQEVQTSNSEKMNQSKGELERLASAIESLKLM